jgi:phosphate uptake regulator
VTEAVKADVMAGTLPFEGALEIIRVSKNLERIADLSSNIAEEALFAIGGTIIKHHLVGEEIKPIEYETIRTNANMMYVG